VAASSNLWRRRRSPPSFERERVVLMDAEHPVLGVHHR
jgi:hypothetical protein